MDPDDFVIRLNFAVFEYRRGELEACKQILQNVKAPRNIDQPQFAVSSLNYLRFTIKYVHLCKYSHDLFFAYSHFERQFRSENNSLETSFRMPKTILNFNHFCRTSNCWQNGSARHFDNCLQHNRRPIYGVNFRWSQFISGASVSQVYFRRD